MIRKILLLIGCVLITVQASAQSENKKENKSEVKKDTTYHGSAYIPNLSIREDAKPLLPDHPQAEFAFDRVRNDDLKTAFTSIYYNNKSIFPFKKRIFVILKGEKIQYLNLANYNLAHISIGFRLTDKIFATTGLLAIKQFTSHSVYGVDRSGSSFGLHYTFTNQLELKIWARYLSSTPFHSPTDFLFPQTGTGASMTLKLGEGSQVDIGSQYQYDPKKEKWNYQSGGKISINF